MSVYKMTMLYIKSVLVMLESLDKKPENEIEVNIGILTDLKKELGSLIDTLQKNS